jgi:hypothetical protein
VGARFAYARFDSARERGASDWVLTVRELAGRFATDGGVAAPPDGPVTGWRLLSENNRELARGCRFAVDPEAARALAASVAALADELEVLLVADERMRGHAWCATHEGLPVAMGARRYENRATARAAGELCVRLLPAAAAAEAV